MPASRHQSCSEYRGVDWCSVSVQAAVWCRTCLTTGFAQIPGLPGAAGPRYLISMRFLRKLWFLPPLQLRAVSEALELPLRPSPRLRRARRLLDFAILLYALELLATGHLVAAAGIVMVLGGLRSGRWILHRPDQPRSLVLAADGSFSLGYAGGRTAAVSLQSESLALGSHLLLVLRGPAHATCRLLGPDNLAPRDLAALKRRLPPRGSSYSGVHSITAPGSKSSDRP